MVMAEPPFIIDHPIPTLAVAEPILVACWLVVVGSALVKLKLKCKKQKLRRDN